MEKSIYLEFAGSHNDISDPWYTSRFDVTYQDVVTGCEAFLKYLKEKGELNR